MLVSRTPVSPCPAEAVAVRTSLARVGGVGGGVSGMEPWEDGKEAGPGAGERVGLPQREVAARGVAATSMAPGETGRVSVKLTPARVDEVGLDKVTLSVAEPPATVALGEKALAM